MEDERMVQLGAPGVYVVEASSGVRPITTVATSVAAFIDYFREGPVNKAVQIFGPADFERTFGGLDPSSPASYAIQQFFLNGGSSAYVVRVMGGTFGAASIEAKNGTSGTTVTAATFKALDEGTWGNAVRVIITPAATGSGAPFNAAIVRYASDKASAKPIAAEQFVALSPKKTDPRFFVDAINATSSLVTVSRASTVLDTEAPVANGTLSADLGTVNLTAPSPGGLSFKVTIGAGTTTSTQRTATIPAGSTATSAAALRTVVEKALVASTPVGDRWDQAFAGLSVQLIGNQLLVRSSPNAPTYSPDEIVSIDPVGTAVTWASTNVQEYWLGKSAGSVAGVGAVTAGTDGTAPGAAELIGSRATQSGLFALETVDLFNLLCIPATAELTSGVGSVLSQAIAYCNERRAFMLIDVPASVNTVQGVQDWLNALNIRDKNAAVYFPRLITPDPVNNFRDKSVAASGTMAGLYSRTDVTRGVWKAPAGVDATLSGVTRLDVKLTDAQNGVLNPLGINCFRSFPVYGDICWGARTLVGADVMASEWKYVPIRRLALMIEESLFRGTKWVVFEPNDEPLWAKIRQNVGAFMLQLFRQGAFQGSTPQTAFYVKCDGETTTANDRNLGIVNIEVGFAPLKPAEFVVLTIRQIPDIVAA
jgi:phage tail sheath protein FI